MFAILWATAEVAPVTLYQDISERTLEALRQQELEAEEILQSRSFQYSEKMVAAFQNMRRTFYESQRYEPMHGDVAVTEAEKITLTSLNVTFEILIRSWSELAEGPRKQALLRSMCLVDLEPACTSIFQRMWLTSTPTWAYQVALEPGEKVFLDQALTRNENGALAHIYFEALGLIPSPQKATLKQTEFFDYAFAFLSSGGSTTVRWLTMSADGVVQAQEHELKKIAKDESAQALLDKLKQMQHAYFSSNRHIAPKDDAFKGASSLMNALDRAPDGGVNPLLIQAVKRVLFQQDYSAAHLTEYLKNYSQSEADITFLKELLKTKDGKWQKSYMSTVCSLEYANTIPLAHPAIQLVDALLRVNRFYAAPTSMAPSAASAEGGDTAAGQMGWMTYARFTIDALVHGGSDAQGGAPAVPLQNADGNPA